MVSPGKLDTKAAALDMTTLIWTRGEILRIAQAPSRF
jgi:hypothetical protein